MYSEDAVVHSIDISSKHANTAFEMQLIDLIKEI